jgi:hypothetical protein
VRPRTGTDHSIDEAWNSKNNTIGEPQPRRGTNNSIREPKNIYKNYSLGEARNRNEMVR